MRIWSLHPKYLDARGLVALWRETLLAQAVLQGKTKGYTNHPQLTRFRDTSSPLGFIASYLKEVSNEADRRGYRFAAGKIARVRATGRLTVTRGQLGYEWRHLMRKLKLRDPKRHAQLKNVKTPQPHPLFRVSRGDVAPWEKITGSSKRPASRRRQRR